jgi:hypothetical protein
MGLRLVLFPSFQEEAKSGVAMLPALLPWARGDLPELNMTNQQIL